MGRALLILFVGNLALASEAVAPIDLVMPEALSAEMQQELEFSLRAAFAIRGYELQSVARVRAQLAGARVPPGCVTGPCLRDVGRALGVRWALVGGISGEGTTFDLSLTVLDIEKGMPVAQGTDRCDVCMVSELKETLRRLAERIAGELTSVSVPAVIQPVPPPRASPLLADTLREPGPIEAVSPQPAVPETDVAHAQRSWSGWKWVALALGVAGVSTGLILLALDGDCANSACEDEYNTGAAGMGFTVGGSAAISVGALVILFGGE